MFRFASLCSLFAVVAFVAHSASAAAPPSKRPKPALLLWKHEEVLSNILFSPDSKRIVAVCQWGRVVVWDRTNGKKLHLFELNDPPLSWAFSPDSKVLAFAGHTHDERGIENWIALWDVVTGKPLWRVSVGSRPGHVGFTPDGKSIVCDLRDVELFSRKEGKRLGKMPSNECGTPFFSEDGKYLAMVANIIEGGMVQVYDLTLRKRICVLDKYDVRVVHARFLPGVLELRTDHEDGKTRIWNLATHKEKSAQQILKFPEREHMEIPGRTLSRDLRLVASCDPKGVVRLFDTSNAEAVWALPPRFSQTGGGKSLMAFSPDGRWLATSINDWALEVWDLHQVRGKR